MTSLKFSYADTILHALGIHRYTNSWSCDICGYRTFEYYGIKDDCCVDENMVEEGNTAQCKECKRMFEIRYKD